MFVSINKMFALAAMLGSTAFASPGRGIVVRDTPAVNPIDLHVGAFMAVESPAKSDTVGGWGGLGYNYWTFAFGGDYNKENYVYTLYKKEGNWNSSIPVPPQAVDKKFNCVIESQAGNGSVTLLDADPWVKKEGAGVKTATCTIKT